MIVILFGNVFSTLFSTKINFNLISERMWVRPKLSKNLMKNVEPSTKSTRSLKLDHQNTYIKVFLKISFSLIWYCILVDISLHICLLGLQLDYTLKYSFLKLNYVNPIWHGGGYQNSLVHTPSIQVGIKLLTKFQLFRMCFSYLKNMKFYHSAKSSY